MKFPAIFIIEVTYLNLILVGTRISWGDSHPPVRVIGFEHISICNNLVLQLYEVTTGVFVEADWGFSNVVISCITDSFRSCLVLLYPQYVGLVVLS